MSIKEFLANAPDHPQEIAVRDAIISLKRIGALDEHEKLTMLDLNSISPNKIIDWFGVNDPLSGFGKLILGESHIKKGNITKGTSLIKDGWITADLNRNDMKYFRKKFKNILNSSDYIKRADYLAYENKYWLSLIHI